MLRMGHQAENVEPLVGDARNRAHRAVGIRRVALAPFRIDVAQHHLPALFHLAQFVFGRDVESFAMLDRQPQDLARRVARVNGVRAFSTRSHTRRR